LFIVYRFLKTTTIRKVDHFPSSGKIMVGPTLLGPLERASLNHCPAILSSAEHHCHNPLELNYCRCRINAV